MKQRYLLILCQLLAITLCAQENNRNIHLKTGEFRKGKNLQNDLLFNESLPRIHYRNNYYSLIQFSNIPGKQEKQLLINAGIRFFGYLPDNTFLVEVPDNITPTALKRYNVTGVYALEPEQKISPKLTASSIQSADPDDYIAVCFVGTIDKATVEKELRKAGAQIATTKIQPTHAVFIHASAAILTKIAALPFVAFISSQRLKAVNLNYVNRGSHGVQAIAATSGRHLTGRGVVVGVGDDGDPSTHVDFTGRLINRNPLPPSNHGTHVTGTTGGAGIVNPKYKGMATQATLVSQVSSDILVNTPYYVTDFGMVLTNNSYYSGLAGCSGDGEYNILSNYVDEQMNNDIELLHVFAAGNDGTGTCAPYPSFFGTVKSGFQCAKNVLTVGAYDNVGYFIANLSSRGPVDDGRLKPEIVAGGAGINSTYPNNGYAANWGTSMAAPTATGSLALLYQRYRQLHGGSNPSASLIKALACNSADDDAVRAGPDYTHGFGILNVRTAVEAMENNTYATGSMNHLDSVTYTITGVPAGTDQIKIMLYWPDAAAAPFSASTLVNNLDLTVIAPGAVMHRPLILDPTPANVNNLAVEGIDNRNNIEQVVIYNPPAGTFTVGIKGKNIPVGPQSYVVAWQVVNPSVTLEYPYGNEAMVPGEIEVFKWNAYGGGNNTFTIEYSLNNGSTWTVIDAAVPATSRDYLWAVPNTPTNAGLVRVTRNTTGLQSVSTYNFTISEQSTLAVTKPCTGYAQLNWTATGAATSYDVMMLQGDSMVVIANTAALNYLLDGLNKDSSYWVAVRPLIGTVPGRHSIARNVVPNSGACAAPTYNNDVSADSLVVPASGRMFTASQLGVVQPRVRIRNLGAVATSGSYNISYQVNGGTVVTESSAVVIAAASTVNYLFTQTYDFSATGVYRVKAWVTFASDTRHKNDTVITVVKQLKNDALLLNPSFTEGFETAIPQSWSIKIKGLDSLDRADFNANNANGRVRTFINTGFAYNGNRAITLDQKSFSFTSSSDSLITTFNLSGYSAADQLWLDFYYRNQGIDFFLPGNQVWIRGSETAAWIPVFVLPTNNNSHFGNYQAAPPIDITGALANAVPVQTVSSSFQVKFGEQGFTSANSVITDGNLDNGFSFDDVTLTRSQNDVGILALVDPDITSICTLTNAETIRVQVKNFSPSTLTSIDVSYDINGSTVTETIPSLTPGQVLIYTFTQTADLSAFGQYHLSAWVNYTSDNYKHNDSLINIVFNTTPVINTYPYREGFETNDGFWYTGGDNSSWEWGTPANTIINKAANGTKAWVTGLSSDYNNSEVSFLYSPCFDLSSLPQPVLSFSHIFRTEDACNCDFHWVEYSLDDITWTKLGASGSGTNWYDNATFQVWQASSTRWQVSSYDIPVNPSKIRFRIVMYSDGAATYEGVGIDDIHVFNKTAIYSGANITSGFTQPVSGSNWINFNMGGNRVVSINPNGQNLGTTEVKMYINAGPIRTSSNQYYLNRNIVIQPSIAPVTPVLVRYYFLNTEANALINATGCGTCHKINDAYEAGVTQYSNAPVEENGTLADNNSGVYHFIIPTLVDVVPYDNGYYAEYEVTNFSEFWINSGGPAHDQTLPLSLGTFTATKTNHTGLLQWTTLQEFNTDKFIIEKSSNGIDYSYLGEVKASGNSTVAMHYQYTDAGLFSGANYYRLKMVDIDGRSGYSPVRKIEGDNNGFTAEVYPNPVSQGTLFINTSVNSTKLELRDVSGRMIKSIQVQGRQHTLSVNHIAKGTYFLTIITDSGNKIQKVFIE
jgi:Subtilase family/Secretion system C-terminal sorting domain